MVNLSTLIREKVERLDLAIPVKDYDNNKIYICRTLHLATGKIIKDENGNAYKVTDFLNNEWIELEPIGTAPNPFVGSVVICPKVHFLSGVPSSVNSEYQQINHHARNKMPLIWLNEIFEEDEKGPGSTIERETTPPIYFMDEANENRWTNEQQDRMVLQPMRNLADWFYQSFRSDRSWKKIINTKTVGRARFGVYVDNRGNDRKIIDEFISAVETRPTLIKYKVLGCEC